MRLTYNQICSVTLGAVRMEQTNGEIRFFRFSEQEQQMYRMRREESWLRSFATAGIRLEFDTNSSFLVLEAEIYPSTSRRFFTHSIFVNGERIGEISGVLPDDVQKMHVKKQFTLGSGNKRISILLPWSVESRLLALELSDGAWFTPVKKARKLLSYGDSITQGYDAEKPENAYIVRLADWLNAELICKAIGGERFCPQLVQLCEVSDPDLITVAYGSNDWSLSGREEFLHDSRAFFQILANRFPDIPIIALAPIWRADMHRQTSVGNLAGIAADYQSIAEEIGNMTVIDCMDFMPHDSDFYRDRKLHPNDLGFRYYADTLIEQVEGRISKAKSGGNHARMIL